MLPQKEKETESLVDFFRTIFRDETGWVYLATRDVHPTQPVWRQFFFEYPTQLPAIVQFCLEARWKVEVFYGPALYLSSGPSKKESVKGSRVVWIEQDGNLPGDFDKLPEPSLRIQSSTEDHQHIYWFMDSLLPPETLEATNRALAYTLDSDSSGWDSTQVLRVPLTKNHKRGREVQIVYMEDTSLSIDQFSNLPAPPPYKEPPSLDSAPAIEDVIAKHPFPEDVWKLFKSTPEVGGRSTALMRLGYRLAELQLIDEEIFAMLLNFDNRIGKFKDRADQPKRLYEIIIRARAKHPLVVKTDDLIFVGTRSLLATEIELKWIWQDFLQEGGYFLLTGQPGVGKTQFSLDFAKHLALGEAFLEKPVERKYKIGFFSLEMGLVELKYFLQTQLGDCERLDELEENLAFLPLGEPLLLNLEEERKRVEKAITAYQLDGIIIDSLGSMTEDELSKESEIKKLMNWNDHIRKEYGIFTQFIHHHRKATGDNKRPNKLSDVFGSMFITRNTSLVLTLWDSGNSSALQAIPLKVRFAKKPSPFVLFRDGKLQFTIHENQSLQVLEEGEVAPSTEFGSPFGKKEDGSDTASSGDEVPANTGTDSGGNPFSSL